MLGEIKNCDRWSDITRNYVFRDDITENVFYKDSEMTSMSTRLNNTW